MHKRSPGRFFGLAGWLTVRWRCARGAWSGWRWRGRRNSEPTWRTWTPPHTRRDLEKMERRSICGARRRRQTGTILLYFLKKAHLQIWHGTCFPVWVSEHKGGSLGQSPSLPRPSGSSDGPNGDSCSLTSLPLKGERKIICCWLTAAMRSTSLRLLKMKQASASSILRDRPFRIRGNTLNKVKMYVVRRSALSGKEQRSFI